MTTTSGTLDAHRPRNGEATRLLLDVPSKSPALGFPERATALSEIVIASDARFAVGIFGGWGSGKTTLMHAIEGEIVEGAPGQAITVWFNAWRYEKEEHLIVPLLDTVREALVKWSDAERARQPQAAALARRTARTVGRVMTSVLAGTSLRVGLPGAVDFSFDANKALEAARASRRVPEERVPRSPYHASFRALSDAFEAFAGADTGRRIVVFVDDLDRCLPERALDVLESMKLFFDLEGFVFVVGLDREIVQEVVESKYRRREGVEGGRERLTGEEYVKKIFQLPFPLAPVPLGDLPEFLEAAYEEAGLPPAQRDELRNVVAPHLEHLVGAGGVNPREVKRYVNAYTLQTKVDPTLDPASLLTAQTIAFRSDWDAVENALLEYGKLFTDACRERTDGINQNALSDLDPELISIPDEFLEYVEIGKPGRALLDTHELDRYIAGGETSGSARDTQLVTAVRELGETRRELRNASARRALAPAELQSVSGRMSVVEGAVAGRSSLLGRLVAEDYLEFQQRASTLQTRLPLPPDAGWDVIAADVEGLEEVARRAAKRLLRLYRFAEVPVGPEMAAKSSSAVPP